MDSADAATPLGGWAWIRGYFTPATLFLVVNLVIGTIALTSRATQQRRRREHYYHDDGHGHHLQEPLHGQMEQPGYGHYYHPEQTLYAAPPPPAPLARTSSVLDRLRSLGLYRFRSGDFPPEFGGAAAAGPPPNHAQDVYAPAEEEETTATAAHYARSRSEPAPAAREEDERRSAPPRVKKSGSEVRKSQVARAVPRTVGAVAEDDDSVEEPVGGFRREPSPLQQEYHYQEEYVPPPARARAPAAPAPLQRTSSVLDRLRSLGLYGFLAPDQPAAAASVPASDGFATPADEKRDAHANAHYDRSRSEPAREQQGKKEKKPEAKSRTAKSSSEARKTPAPSPVEAGGECVNARAEAFIDSFRKQQQEVVVQHYQEDEYVPPPAPAPPLSRTSSVLDRLRSFSLYRFRSGDLGPDLPPTAAAATETDEEKQQAAHYGRSQSEPGKKKPQEARMSKSSSSAAVEEEAETEQCVDARADDFINKFRQQLQLQRLNSLLNYKEMLNRGGGGKQ